MWNLRLSFLTVLTGTAFLFVSKSSPAAAPAAPPAPSREQQLEQRLELLDQKVRILERRVEVKEENDLLKIKETPVVGAGPDGFFLKSPKNDFQLSIKGLIQADGRFFVNEEDSRNTSTYLLRRVRPSIQGTLFDYFDFALVPDFGNGTTVLQDAWIEYRYFPKAKVRFGKFKTPFGLERLQSAKDLEFVERALPTQLVPNRDEGIQLSGDFKDGLFTYAVANLNGVNDGGSTDADNADTKDVAARVFVQPFKATSIEWLQNLGMGLAMTYGNAEGTPASYKTAGQETFFKYNTGVTLAGQRVRYSPQFYYYRGPFGMMGEYVSSSQDLEIPPVKASKTSPAMPAVTKTLTNDAWQLAVYYVLTGENASYKGVKPRNPFDMESGHWGAWELVGRYGQIEVDQDAFRLGYANINMSARKASEWSAGVNWYLNRNLRYMLDYSRTGFDGGAVDGNRDPENVFMTRMQLAF